MVKAVPTVSDLLTILCHLRQMSMFTGLWSQIRERRESNRNARARILLWATLAGLIFGAIEFGQPLEDMLRIGRNLARSHPASGDIVVVAIDDRSLDRVEQWPWPRRYHAQLAEKLNGLGARRILFDIDFSSRSHPQEDRAFAATLARLGQKVTLAIRFVIDPVTGDRTDNFPIPAFRRHVQLANINVRYNRQGAAWELPYGLSYEGVSHPSFAATLSGRGGETGEMFPIDYAISPRSIPVVSAADIIEGRVSVEQIAGKDVVIGTTSLDLGDIYFLPGTGRLSGVYLHVLGAETLKQGRPISVTWLVPFFLAFLLAAAALSMRSGRAITVAFVIAVAALLLLPLFLEARLVFINVTPALFLLIVGGGSVAWSSFKRSYRERGTINSISGLPNLNALRLEKLGRDRTLVAARIQNYAEVASALPAEQEKALVEQIAARLAIGAAGHKLYQGDEGIFAWLSDQGVTRSFGEHLDALHALFRSPVIIADNQVDLTVTFGFDASNARSLANRLGSALVAADEAASESLRWKEYDPAKLKDAAWKLSLLSQLDGAIESGDLWVAYQPKLDLKTSTIIGAEALVRWTHPDKGPISPLEFILAAEQSDRIERLTAFVLDRAVGAAAAVNRKGIPFQISVNLSARLIDQPSLVSSIRDLLAKHELAPHRLTLEITETAALTTSGSSLDALLELRYLGVDISIDDYGTGLSTLDYLKKIPATEIKIDKSFVQAIEKSHSDRLLVHSTIQLAHSLGQKVVAEGVEDSETLKTLERMGCDLAQGYLIGRPVNFRTLLKQLSEELTYKIAKHG
jgi:EAL domain-containing protein (putative c-di-GMP-specific phosphodiesterase class I)/CHASE2 domain-containing sensor protein